MIKAAALVGGIALGGCGEQPVKPVNKIQQLTLLDEIQVGDAYVRFMHEDHTLQSNAYILEVKDNNGNVKAFFTADTNCQTESRVFHPKKTYSLQRGGYIIENNNFDTAIASNQEVIRNESPTVVTPAAQKVVEKTVVVQETVKNSTVTADAKTKTYNSTTADESKDSDPPLFEKVVTATKAIGKKVEGVAKETLDVITEYN